MCPVLLDGRAQPAPHQINVASGRSNAALALLLEAMKHIDAGPQFHGIDRAISVPVEVFDNLQNSNTTKALEWLGAGILQAFLGQPQRRANSVLNRLR